MAGCLLVLIVLVFFAALWAVWRYNRLVTLQNQVANAWKQIDVQLKRRHDLIPNLVSPVKGEMEFEQDTLEEVIPRAQQRGRGATGRRPTAAEGGELTAALSAASSPWSRTTRTSRPTRTSAAQEELTTTENKIGFARQFYNDIATRYNIAQQVFPASVIAAASASSPSSSSRSRTRRSARCRRWTRAFGPNSYQLSAISS